MSEEQESGTDRASLTSEDADTKSREPSPLEVATLIAEQLGETEEGARKQIGRIVWALGRTQARALLSRTLLIEEQGGMVLPDQSRRRTKGGVFFHLAYTQG